MSDEIKKTKQLCDLSHYFDDYIRQYQMDWEYRHQPVISALEVDEVASKIAKAYEKVREVIDWKEENLLRRAAIERILKRRLVSKLYGISIMPDVKAKEIAEPMALELMRSGYFDSGRIGRKQVTELENILNKYIKIMSDSRLPRGNDDVYVKKKINFYNWIIELAACEIEELLFPNFKENALINLMTNVLYKRIKILPSNKVSDMEKFLQTYIAVHRTLYNFDNPIIAFNLIKIKYPFWVKEDPKSVKQVTEQAVEIRQEIEKDLEKPLGKGFFQIAAKYDAAYRLINDITDEINDTPSMVKANYADEEKLDKLIETVYDRRRKNLKKKLFRSAIYSTLSIFVAGGASFIIFEGPVARWAGVPFSILTLFFDLLIPSFVMFLLVLAIRPPHPNNFPVVVKEIKKIVYHQAEEDVYELALNKKKNKFLHALFVIISTLFGLAGLALIFWVFKIAKVPWTSMYIDTVFTAMVFFAATAIKATSKEITIQDKGNILESFLDLFSVPMAKIGQWFSNKWREYNIVSALFTALVDTPFSAIIRLVEDWRNFLKEKSAEIH
ncbi:MAG: hypothetical protein WCR60_01635 [Patescibacteria group bacterium]|jgi:hypothetical protein